MSILHKTCIALGLAAGLAALPAHATTQTVLHSMCSSASCADGAIPQSQLIKSGNILYGVTPAGGSHKSASHSAGAVFKYDLSNSTYTVIYNFCTTIHLGVCSDGEGPTGRLVIDSSGNLYGTTNLGGNHNNAGTVYKLTNSGGTWTRSTLYEFCPEKVGDVSCADGDDPLSGLTYYGQASGATYDGTSPLYGSTYVGGSDWEGSYGNGTIFSLTNSGGTWTENVLVMFCPLCTELCTICSDGELPFGQMIMDSSGNIYGTTRVGGSKGSGTVFKINTAGPYSVLYNFCPSGGSCSDGKWPSGVLLDASGNIYGTTDQGGSPNAGVLWKLTNSSGTWSQSVKYNFCAVSGCSDGSGPNGDLIMDGSGNIYGTTNGGGNGNHAGTVWKYDGTNETVLYTFCPSSGCADGQNPAAGVMMDASGNLYGDTIAGGSNAEGTAFKLVP